MMMDPSHESDARPPAEGDGRLSGCVKDPYFGRRMEEKAAPAVAEREYGVSSDFASITLDFGDFSYMSTTVRRLAEEKAVDAPVPASDGAKGFDRAPHHRARQARCTSAPRRRRLRRLGAAPPPAPAGCRARACSA